MNGCGKTECAAIRRSFPKSGALPEHTSDYTAFEAPDPMYWTHHGYAIIVADCPGTWYGDGKVTYASPEEAEIFYDLIEWARVQEWSSGLVGLGGVSYLAVMQVRPFTSGLTLLARCRITSSPSWSN
jgi:uncharacterized protein